MLLWGFVMKIRKDYSFDYYFFLQGVYSEIEGLDLDNEFVQVDEKRRVMGGLGIKEKSGLLSVRSDLLLTARRQIWGYLDEYRGEFERDRVVGEQMEFEFSEVIRGGGVVGDKEPHGKSRDVIARICSSFK